MRKILILLLMLGWCVSGQITSFPASSGGGTPAAHKASHQDGGLDEIATAVAAANAIPKAGAAGLLAIGWIPALTGDVTKSDGSAATTLIDKLRTFTKSFSVPDPVTGDNGRYHVSFPYAVTITRVYCSTNDSGAGTATVNANLDERAEATPNTTGTSVLSAALVCDTGTRTSCASGCDVNTITNGGIAANAPIVLLVSATANTPTDLRIHFDYKID